MSRYSLIHPSIACGASLLLLVAGCAMEPTGVSNGVQNQPPGTTDPVSYSLALGPLGPIAAGTENTECVIERLGNPTPIEVDTIHTVLSDTTHHLSVYAVNDTVEQKTPFQCAPLAGSSPLVFTHDKDGLVTYPAGAGISLDTNQMIRLELHYANASLDPVMVSASITMTATPDGK
ncbi:MAG TPA: hypothetical protein VII38_12430 [Polyangia bacterium]